MRRIYLIIITFLLFSCDRISNHEGLWLSCCSQDSKDSTLVLIGSPPQRYYHFKNGQFKYGEYLKFFDEYSESEYRIDNGKFYIGDNKESWVDILFPSSEEMRLVNQNDLVYIFKRLDDSLKYKGDKSLELNNRTFKILKGNQIIDTASFKYKSMVTWVSNIKNTGADKWIIHDISGFKILSIRWLPQSVIYKAEKNHIYLKTLGKETYDLIFEEIY